LPCSKVISTLTAGGYSPNLSKALGAVLFDMQQGNLSDKLPIGVDILTNPEEFEVSKPAIFTQGSSIYTAFRDDHAAAKDSIEAKTDELRNAMTQNPTWVGAMGRTVMDPKALHKVLAPYMALHGVGMAMPGNEPWLAVHKAGAYRYGAGATPLPGVGCLIWPGTLASHYVLLLPVKPILANGIALRDVKSFLETESGLKFLKDHCVVVPFAIGAVLYVPYGYVYLPLFYDTASTEGSLKTMKNKKKELTFDTHLVFSIFAPQLAKDLDLDVWTAIVSSTMEVFSKKPADKLWVGRKSYYDTFLDAVVNSKVAVR
jgi:hypothetical protein